MRLSRPGQDALLKIYSYESRKEGLKMEKITCPMVYSCIRQKIANGVESSLF